MKEIMQNSICIKRLKLGTSMTNCYVVGSRGTKAAVAVDPGDGEEIVAEYLESQGLALEAILLTHGHFDHIYGVDGLRRMTGARVYAGAEEKELLEDAALNCSSQIGGRAAVVFADQFAKEGETLGFRGFSVRVIKTPGHTKGSVCYLLKEEPILFSGDTLFLESVGRTDLPTGNALRLMESLQKKIFELDESVLVLPGHGDQTTIGYEKRNNPFGKAWE